MASRVITRVSVASVALTSDGRASISVCDSCGQARPPRDARSTRGTREETGNGGAERDAPFLEDERVRRSHRSPGDLKSERSRPESPITTDRPVRHSPAHTDECSTGILLPLLRSRERPCSPAEDVPFDASANVFPVGRSECPGINGGASSFDLCSPRFVHLLLGLGIQAQRGGFLHPRKFSAR